MSNTKRSGRPPYDDILTPAEWRVVDAVRHGLTNPQIASGQNVSMDAVKYHVANALQKLGFSSRKELQKWDGIKRDSNLFRRASKMTKSAHVGQIGQISRSVSDIEAACSWYREKLELTHLYTFENVAFFDCDGLRLFLSESENQTSDSIIYFRVDDIHHAHETLQARGIKFINAPHMIHRHENGNEEWMAFFKDNEEKPLAIMSEVAKEN